MISEYMKWIIYKMISEYTKWRIYNIPDYC